MVVVCHLITAEVAAYKPDSRGACTDLAKWEPSLKAARLWTMAL